VAYLSHGQGLILVRSSKNLWFSKLYVRNHFYHRKR